MPVPPLLRRPGPASYLHLFFKIFQTPPFKRGGEGEEDPNYVDPTHSFANFWYSFQTQANLTPVNVMRCAIYYYLYNLKKVKAPTEECYF